MMAANSIPNKVITPNTLPVALRLNLLESNHGGGGEASIID
jgi:hypothetical protein